MNEIDIHNSAKLLGRYLELIAGLRLTVGYKAAAMVGQVNTNRPHYEWTAVLSEVLHLIDEEDRILRRPRRCALVRHEKGDKLPGRKFWKLEGNIDCPLAEHHDRLLKQVFSFPWPNGLLAAKTDAAEDREDDADMSSLALQD